MRYHRGDAGWFPWRIPREVLVQVVGAKRFAAVAIVGAAVIAAVSALPAPARAQALFAPEPVWTTAAAGPATHLLVTDLDADGHPELLRINRSNPSQLFLNRSGRLDLVPTWTSEFTSTVTAGAVGDLNGDGMTDVVLTTADGDAVIYHQQRETEILPGRPSGRIEVGGASSIVLVDADLDFDLDAVTSHPDSGLALWLADGEVFAREPAWRAPGGATHVALADVDRDDYLDVIAGGAGGALRLYRGDGTTFAATPSWERAGENASSLALGDLDADGDLDLVVGGVTPQPVRIWENLGTTFALVPAATLTGEDSTLSVALGDADNDGDLDLALGNTDRSRVYRHVSGLMGWELAWQSPQPLAYAVAWIDSDGDGLRDLTQARGLTEVFHNVTDLFAAVSTPTAVPGRPLLVVDIDLDGDGDLVTLSGGTAHLHLNDAGQFATPAAWTSTGVTNPRAAVAGDLNADGRIDLVLGGDNAIAAFLGMADSLLASTPAWSEPADNIVSLALDDVDRDGDPDLAVARGGAGELRYYGNRFGRFQSPPDWRIDHPAPTSIALGDVDGDGDLDLAAGSATEGAVLFYFDGQRFGEFPVWRPLPGVHTSAVRLEDVDGDSFLDVVVANVGFSMTFTTPEGVPVLTPTWTSPTSRVHDLLAVEDTDADGDLDILLFSSTGDEAELHPNQGGQYAQARRLPTAAWNGALVADADNDGDLDLILGTETTIGIHRGIAAPGFRGDPQAPVNQLADNEPFLRDVRVSTPSTNVSRIELTAVDLESDSLWVVAEYQPRGGGWAAVESEAGRGLVGPIAASPAGVPYAFDWDLSRITSTRIPFTLRLRPTPYRPRTSVIQRVAGNSRALGRVQVRRPEIAANPLDVVLETITVGDTVSFIVDIRNRGATELEITAFEFERTEMMRTNPPAPLAIAPGHRAEVIVYYEPTAGELTAPPGAPRLLHIVSNDPVYPRRTVLIQAQSLELEGFAQALVTGRRGAPLGQPVVVQGLAAQSVHIETARLFYAFMGSDQFDVVDMDRFGSSFIGSIPAHRVTERHIEFYVEFENSGIVVTDPPRAPADSLHLVIVESPTEIRVVPQPTSRADFLVGRDVNVIVTMPLGAEFVDGNLYYRKGGDSEFTAVPIKSVSVEGSTYAQVPAEDVGPRGLEYWVEVNSLTRPLRFPLDGELTPDSIRTLVPSLVEPSTSPGGRYRMLSVPLDFGAQSPDALDALLSDQPEFGPYDPVRWRAFRFMGDSVGNVEREAGDPQFFVEPGRAFWLISRADHRVDTAPAEGLSIPVRAFTIPLQPGWNQIGAPFAFPVAWARVGGAELVEAPIAFDPTRGTAGDYRPEPATLLEPFQGYFVFNPTDALVMLDVPPVAAVVDSGAGGEVVASQPAPGGFTIEVTATGGASMDGGNRAAVDVRAADALDALDAHEPPAAPGEWVQVAFVAEGSTSHLRRDVRAPNADGHTWHLDVRSSRAAREVTLDLRIAGDVPGEFEVVVFDDDVGQVVRVPRAGGGGSGGSGGSGDGDGDAWRVTLPLLGHGPDRAYRLRLVAGTAAYIAGAAAGSAVAPPARAALDQNAPNPFNAATRLRFGVPQTGPVRLELFDVRGRRVATLLNGVREAGWHAILWNGRDDRGHTVASGVYIARLWTPQGTVTRRLTAIE